MRTTEGNWSGIQKEDFTLLCERFATSKISKYEDLEDIHSFGFRGEALASLALVSNLTVSSKRKEQHMGYKANYVNGKLSKELES